MNFAPAKYSYLQVSAVVVFLSLACGNPMEDFQPNLEGGVSVDLPVNDEFDKIFANVRRLAVEKQMDPITLPSDSDNFTATIFGSVLDGYVWVGDGAVRGLATLHRTGNMSIKFKLSGQKVSFEGHTGITDLTGKYSARFNLGPFKSNFGISIKISFVSLGIKVSVSIPPSNVHLDECQVDDLSTIQVQLKGIGVFDSKMYSLLVNALTQLLEPVITRKLEGVVCNLLQNAVNGQ